MDSQQPTLLKPFTTIPAHLQTIADYEQQARLHLSAATWEYLQGGAMDEISIRENREQFEQIKLIPRHLKDLTQGQTQLSLFGQNYPHPIFMAPIYHQSLFHPQAEKASAMAAEVLQSNFILSTFTNTDLGELHPENPYKWFQLYWQADRQKSLELVKLAEQQHFKALVVTIDSPHTGIRDRERKAFFNSPKTCNTPTHLLISWHQMLPLINIHYFKV